MIYTSFNTATLDIDFEFGFLDDKTMSVAVEFGSWQQKLMPTSAQSSMSCKVPICLPGHLVMRFDGKMPDDTRVDQDGNIIQDKYVKITGIALDGFAVSPIFLYQRLKLITVDGREIITAYVGFNGTMTINMDAPDVFTQYARMIQ